MYVITGATGNIGQRIAENLLSAGAEVRVVGRDKKKLQALADKSAEPFEADFTDLEIKNNISGNAKAANES